MHSKLLFFSEINSFTSNIKAFKVAKRHKKCFYCDKYPTHFVTASKSSVIFFNCNDNTLFNIDHKIPRSKGGSEFLDNLALSCVECNTRKDDKLISCEDKPRIRLFFTVEKYHEIPKGALVILMSYTYNQCTILYNNKRYKPPISVLGKEIINKRINNGI